MTGKEDKKTSVFAMATPRQAARVGREPELILPCFEGVLVLRVVFNYLNEGSLILEGGSLPPMAVNSRINSCAVASPFPANLFHCQ